jgi:peptidyl-prolyl cis-trans isomerase B (cyclophilin B)
MKKISILFSLICLICSCKTAQIDSKPKVVENIEHEVLISTDLGDMVVKLYNQTPKHRDNFLKLVNEKFYDSLLFHRVIKNFMIQGGDPQSKNAAKGVMLGSGDVGYTIPAEFVDTLIHKKGALAAARTENPEKASSGCQFYIVQGTVLTEEQANMMKMQRGVELSPEQKRVYSTIGGTPFLDKNYTVFGEVIQGLDVLDKIAAVQTAPGDRPLKDIHMSMKVIK